MSEILDKAVAALRERLGDVSFGAAVEFRIEGEGSVFVDGAQSPPAVSTDGGAPAVTLSATKDTFRRLMTGELSPIAASMSGQIKIDGDMGAAMKLAGVLAG